MRTCCKRGSISEANIGFGISLLSRENNPQQRFPLKQCSPWVLTTIPFTPGSVWLFRTLIARGSTSVCQSANGATIFHQRDAEAHVGRSLNKCKPIRGCPCSHKHCVSARGAWKIDSLKIPPPFQPHPTKQRRWIPPAWNPRTKKKTFEPFSDRPPRPACAKSTVALGVPLSSRLAWTDFRTDKTGQAQEKGPLQKNKNIILKGPR